MPASELDLIRGGLSDFRLDNLRISRHALDRARERHIPLEDLRRTHRNEVGRGIQVGNTIVTAITNTMSAAAPKREKILQIRRQIECIGVCPSLKTQHPVSYAFFRDLFQNHPMPEKKRVTDIVDISLRNFSPREPVSSWRDLQFVLHYPFGRSDSVSWKKCV